MYLVAECSTISAPKSSGFCKYGEAKVLSTQVRTPLRRAMPQSASRSTTLSMGLVGVSIHSRRVAGVIRLSTRAASLISVNVLFNPHGPYTRTIWRYEPP